MHGRVRGRCIHRGGRLRERVVAYRIHVHEVLRVQEPELLHRDYGQPHILAQIRTGREGNLQVAVCDAHVLHDAVRHVHLIAFGHGHVQRDTNVR